jgi:hypothetical protein
MAINSAWRTFIAALCRKAFAWPLVARAQQSEKLRRIGRPLGVFAAIALFSCWDASTITTVAAQCTNPAAIANASSCAARPGLVWANGACVGVPEPNSQAGPQCGAGLYGRTDRACALRA